MKKMISYGWDFLNKFSFDVTIGIDEKSGCETFNVDDNIIIHFNNLQKGMSDAYCCKICTKHEVEKKFLNFMMYSEKYKEELLQTSLMQKFTSGLMRFK